jgi:hypothetical protein
MRGGSILTGAAFKPEIVAMPSEPCALAIPTDLIFSLSGARAGSAMGKI